MNTGTWIFFIFIGLVAVSLYFKTRSKSKMVMREGKVVDFVVKGEKPKDDDAEGS